MSTESSTPRITETGEDEAERFWEGRYRDYTGPWAVRPNPLLAEVAGPLTHGAALDLGCGVGGDAVWLARRGWRVTAVDISAVSVEAQAHEVARAAAGPRARSSTEGSGPCRPATAGRPSRDHDLSLDGRLEP